MKIIIFLVSVAAASAVATIIAKSFGIESANMIGGGVGCVVGAIVWTKMFSKQKKDKE